MKSWSTVPLICLFLIFSARSNTLAQNHPVVQWINNSAQDAHTELNSTGHSTTSFKSVNDVAITMTNGSVNSIYAETLSASSTQTNPPYLTGFVGSAANGSGDGTIGHIKGLETALNTTLTLQFDFSIPLTPQDRILIFDCDSAEQYVVTAFSNHQVINLSAWNTNSFSGQRTQLPDSTSAKWTTTTTNGTLTANVAGNLIEPLFVLTPGQTVDRIVINKVAGNGSAAIQFLNLSVLSLQIQQVNTNVVISWPDGFGTETLLKKSTALNSTNDWIAVMNVPALIANQWYVTNHISNTNTFFRLQGSN